MRMMIRRAVAILLVPVLAVAVHAVVASAAPSPGCLPAAAPVFADNSFTPVEGTYTVPQYPSFESMGASPATAAAVAASGIANAQLPAGQAARFVVNFGPDGRSVMLVSAPGQLPAQATVVDLARAGGMEIVRQPAGNGSAAEVLAAVGARAVPLKIGAFDAALVHADPVGSDDLRPYELHWSDGANDFMVYGVVPPTDVIATGRALACH